jgi:hypothetical protein
MYESGGNFDFRRLSGRIYYQYTLSSNFQVAAAGAAWNHYPVATRSLDATPAIGVYQAAAGNAYVDDLYAFLLDDVSLTVTPASEANSAETTGLRVDGRDTCTQ